jgi:hypothetical protein
MSTNDVETRINLCIPQLRRSLGLSLLSPPRSQTGPGKRGQMTRRVEALTVSECRQLLKEHHFRRLAIVEAVGVALIIPGQLVASRRHGGVSNDAGSQRAASSPRRSLTFEVDGVGQDRQLGWNAVVRGPTEEVTDSINSPDFGAFPWWRGTPARPPPLLTHQIEPGDRHAHHDCRPAANWQG